MNSEPPSTPLQRFAWIMRDMIQTVAERLDPRWRFFRPVVSGRIPCHELMMPTVVHLIVVWLQRKLRAFETAIAAGPAPAPLPRVRKPAAAKQEVDAIEEPRPERLCLPRRFGWLGQLGNWPVRGCGSQLRFLLGEPEMQEVLRENPHAAHILRPLCHALGIDPSLLTPPPAPPPSDAEARAEPVPEAPPEPPFPEPVPMMGFDSALYGFVPPPPPKTTG